MSERTEDDETVRLPLRIPKSLHERLAAVAKIDRRSLNQQAITYIEKALEEPDEESQ